MHVLFFALVCLVSRSLDVPNLERDVLAYCPPTEDAFMNFSCVGSAKDSKNIRFLMNHAEEVEWAVADAQESGKLSAEQSQPLLLYLESHLLLLCWQNLECAFQDAAQRNYWFIQFIKRCHELQHRALHLRPGEAGEDLCFDFELQVSVLDRAHRQIISDGTNGLQPAHAWLPGEVSPPCQGLQHHADVGPMQPWAWLPTKHGKRLLSAAVGATALLLDYLRKKGDDAFVVNLGASDGRCQLENLLMLDVANCAFDLGVRGIAIEGRDGEALRGRWQGVEAFGGYVSPSNVTSLMPLEPVSLLKIDLDHADCRFAEAILSSMPVPEALYVEYNRAMPPPVRLREKFSEQTVEAFSQVEDNWLVFAKKRHWGGCSMQAWQDLAESYGFELVQADFNDLLFLQKGLAERLGLRPAHASLFEHWLAAAHCVVPGRHLFGLQYHAAFDFRALAEAPERERCRLAKAWWLHEGADETSDLAC